MLLHIRHPLLPRRKRLPIPILGRRPIPQTPRPRPLHNPPRPNTPHNNLIRKPAPLRQNQHIERVIEIITIDYGVSERIACGQRNTAAGFRGEELGDDGEDVFVGVGGDVGVLFGAAVAFCSEELDGGLFGWEEVHWVAFIFVPLLLALLVFLP